MEISNFWHNKKVFLTGHTGFKGSWLSIWLTMQKAHVFGYALAPQTKPSLFDLTELDQTVHSCIDDIRNFSALKKALLDSEAEIVIHMAAQPLVRESYFNPVETYATNVMGTVHILEAIRSAPKVRSVVIVTSDKCYENKEWIWAYRESEPMGGYDPYSNSKGCAELVTSSYRNSFFNPTNYSSHHVAIGSARAGNVIGGGDWSKDRLVPDILKSFEKNSTLEIRNPNAIRPWQHVLEPLSGYLRLAEKLYTDGVSFADSWNFGPSENEAKPVEWIVQMLSKFCEGRLKYKILSEKENSQKLHEAYYLKLDSSKARAFLNWQPRWNLESALHATIDWHKIYMTSPKKLKNKCFEQIENYENSSPSL